MGLPTKFDAELRLRFLQLYSLCGQIQRSAQECGISPTTVRKLAKKDPDFAEAMAEALCDYKEAVERELVRRAVLGYDEPVYQKGEQVGTIRKHSDRLLELLIKKLDPSYKEKAEVDVNVTGGVLAIPATESKDDWAKRNAVEAEYEEEDK